MKTSIEVLLLITHCSKLTFMELGYSKGEICNRNSCAYVIKEEDKVGSCSCHVNPPCSYCTTQTGYCEGCGWIAEDEIIAQSTSSHISVKIQDGCMSRINSIREKIKTGKGITKFESFYETHTHFTMKKTGVYPQ